MHDGGKEEKPPAEERDEPARAPGGDDDRGEAPQRTPPHPERVGEGGDNLRRRRDWFRKRTGQEG
jgi:hypothetical protein